MYRACLPGERGARYPGDGGVDVIDHRRAVGPLEARRTVHVHLDDGPVFGGHDDASARPYTVGGGRGGRPVPAETTRGRGRRQEAEEEAAAVSVTETTECRRTSSSSSSRPVVVVAAASSVRTDRVAS